MYFVAVDSFDQPIIDWRAGAGTPAYASFVAAVARKACG